MRPKFLKSIFIRAGNNPWHERRRIKFETKLKKVNKPILILMGRGHRKSFLAFLNPEFGCKIHFCTFLFLIVVESRYVVLTNQGLEFSSSIWLYVWMNVSRLQNRTSLLRLLLGDVEKKEQAPNDDDTSPDVMVNLASHQQWLKDGLLQKTVMKQLYYIKPLHSSKKFWFLVSTTTTVLLRFSLQTFKNCLHFIFESDFLYFGDLSWV